MTEPALPPIDWASLRPGSTGGGRIARDRPSVDTIWKCVACAAENTGPLGDGCTSCGSGAPGKFVGIDPPAKPRESAHEAAYQALKVFAPETARSPVETACEAYIHLLTTTLPGVDDQIARVAREAFMAGVAWSEKNLLGRLSPQIARGDLPLTGSKEFRTLVAALTFFKEAVLSQWPEEVNTGEWCGAAEVDQLIAQLEGRS